VVGGVLPDMEATLQWISHDGSVETVDLPRPARAFFLPRLSPDGSEILLATLGLRDRDLWKYNIGQRSLLRLTSDAKAENGLWNKTGDSIAFGSPKSGTFQAYIMPADSSAAPRQLTNENSAYPGQWTPDGRGVVMARDGDLIVVTVGPPSSSTVLRQTPFDERMPVLSPDGKWIAFSSDESGSYEIYVASFPALANKRRISADGGLEPAWSATGRLLTFLRRDPQQPFTTIMEAQVTTGESFTATAPRKVVDLDRDHYLGAAAARSYDLSLDGRRFLFVSENYPPETNSLRDVQLVQNWFEELKERVPR
jgi:Tol biopolymer transport system component